MDGGAYVTLTPVVLSRGALHAAGAYRWEHVRDRGASPSRRTRRRTARSAASARRRRSGRSSGTWTASRATLGIDPLELREKNLAPRRRHDRDRPGADGVGRRRAECIEEGEPRRAAIDDEARGVRQPVASARTRKARGIGASVFMHGAGFTGSGERELKGKVAVDSRGTGDGKARFRIRTASTDIGQGTETVFRQIAADARWVSDRPRRLRDAVAPTTVPDSGPTVASRTVMVVGSIVESAPRASSSRRIEGEPQPGRRVLRRGRRCGSSPRDGHGHRRDGSTSRRRVSTGTTRRTTATPIPCFGWACDIAEVEVDLDTFETPVLGLLGGARTSARRSTR